MWWIPWSDTASSACQSCARGGGRHSLAAPICCVRSQGLSGPWRQPPERMRTSASTFSRSLADQAWVSKSFVNVEVDVGVVKLRGSILDEGERQALHVVAENTPGVKTVKDHLVWVEPI